MVHAHTSTRRPARDLLRSAGVLACSLLLVASFGASAFAQAGATPGAKAKARPAKAQKANSSGVPLPTLPKFKTDDAAVYGRQIADYADLYDTGWKDSYAASTMTLYAANGDSVKRKSVQMILEGSDGDKSIVRFLTPAEIKGVAALTHEKPDANDDNWLYLPATKRVRRISGANKTASFQGTEFTYEDLSNRIVRKYDWRFVREGELEVDGVTQKTLEVEARPRYGNTGYSKLVIHYNAANWRQERVEFFDKAGRLLKVLSGSKWKLRHGRFWRPNVLEMKNVQTKKRTVLVTSTVLLNLALYKSKRTGKARKNMTNEMFTTRALTRRR